MFLHHIATVTLYGGMIVNNCIIPGSLFAFIHLIVEVPVCFVKGFSSTNLKTCSVVSFKIMIAVWFWTRNVTVLWLTYSTYLYYVYPSQLNDYQSICQIKCFLLVTLCILHYYWLALFIRALSRFLKDGKPEDINNRIEKRASELNLNDI